MIAGIVIDSWKLSIFKRRLDADGWKYTEVKDGDSYIILKVEYTKETFQKLNHLVNLANQECKRHAGTSH